MSHLHRTKTKLIQNSNSLLMMSSCVLCPLPLLAWALMSARDFNILAVYVCDALVVTVIFRFLWLHLGTNASLKRLMTSGFRQDPDSGTPPAPHPRSARFLFTLSRFVNKLVLHRCSRARPAFINMSLNMESAVLSWSDFLVVSHFCASA